MKKLLLPLIPCFLLFGSFHLDKKLQSENDTLSKETKVLVLKIDYLSNKLEGAKELTFPKQADTFTIHQVYEPPNDLGRLRLYYKELNELIFDGSIVWNGSGKIAFPDNFESAEKFELVSQTDTIYPAQGFTNASNSKKRDDFSKVWLSIQNLKKVRNYLQENPNQSVQVLLYIPSTGFERDGVRDWIVFLKK